MKVLREKNNKKEALIFTLLVCLFIPGVAVQGVEETESDTIHMETMGEYCAWTWMDDNEDRVEFDEEDDIIVFPRNKVIAPDYDSFALTIHEVNKKGDNHLAYSFFYLCDPEIGDITADTGYFEDYFDIGYDNDFVCGEGLYGTGDASGCMGSYPGRHLTNAVRMVNWY